MDHHAPTEPLLASGWVIALIGGAIAAGLTALIGATLPAVLVLGVVAFGVFGVLLGKGGVELTEGDHVDQSGGHH
jgi:hypothetical protein